MITEYDRSYSTNIAYSRSRSSWWLCFNFSKQTAKSKSAKSAKSSKSTSKKAKEEVRDPEEEDDVEEEEEEDGMDDEMDVPIERI